MPERKGGDTVMRTISVRLPNEVVNQIDAVCEKFRKDRPLENFSRTDAVRMLVVMGLMRFNERGEIALPSDI